MNQGAPHRLALIGTLYSTQNLSLGFYTYAFLTIAQQRGVPLATIGTASGIAILLTLKFVWAPVVDRFGWARVGHYRGWLLLTQTLLVAGFVLIATLEPARDFSILVAAFALIFVVAGTQDVAADATATKLLGPAERGLGNGLQSAGSSVAQVVGGGLVLVIYEAAGWRVAALTLAVLSAVALPFVATWRERPEATDATAAAAPIRLRDIGRFFTDRRRLLWCALMPVYTFGFTIGYNLVRPILVEAGWSAGRIGLVVVIAGSAFGIVGGVLAGVLIARTDRRRALLVLGLVQLIATAAVLPLALGWSATWLVVVAVALANGAFGAAFAIVYTISMDLTRLASAGTDFTLFTTIASIAMVVAGALAVGLADVAGFSALAAAGVVLAALGLVVVARSIAPVLARSGAESGELLPFVGNGLPAGDPEPAPD